jgi:hypothetical protein
MTRIERRLAPRAGWNARERRRSEAHDRHAVEWETGAVAVCGPALSTHFVAGAAVPRPRLRFQPPLIKLGMRFSRTQLSEIVHRVPIGAALRPAMVPLSRYIPSHWK